MGTRLYTTYAPFVAALVALFVKGKPLAYVPVPPVETIICLPVPVPVSLPVVGSIV